MRPIILAIAAAGLATAATASAETLVLVDVDQATGTRLANDAFFDQTLARQTRMGMLRPIVAPLADDGASLTARVPVIAPAPIIATQPGHRYLSGSETMTITTRRDGARIGYDITIARASGFVDGFTPPTNVASGSVRLQGDATIQPGSHSPTFAARYQTNGGQRMLIGYVAR